MTIPHADATAATLKPVRLTNSQLAALYNTWAGDVPARPMVPGRPLLWRVMVVIPDVAARCEPVFDEKAGTVLYESSVTHAMTSQRCPLGGPGDELYIHEPVEVLEVHAPGPGAFARISRLWDSRTQTVFFDQGAAPRVGRFPGVLPAVWARPDRLVIRKAYPQRLHSISEEQAEAMGAVRGARSGAVGAPGHSFILGYQQIWNELHSVRHSWAAGNWLCWAVEFWRKLDE